MKKRSIFVKSFCISFCILILVIILAHAIMWFVLPIFSTTKQEIPIENGQYIVNEINNTIVLQQIAKKAMPISITGCIFIAFAFSYIWAKITVKPIKYIVDTTKKMSNLEPDIACSLKTGDEFEELSDNINRLYSNLFVTIKELKEQIYEVKENEQSKVDFLYAASHELKTPISACNAILENMILKVGKYSNYEEYLPVCKKMIDDMGKMIQVFLDTTKLRSKSLQPKYENLNLKRIIDEICEPYYIIAKTQNIHFRVIMEVDIEIMTDQSLLKKALSNIISNAVFYTKESKNVEIKGNQNYIVISNECTVIDEENLKHIFKPFYRLENSRSREYGGNGLGLYIVDCILSALNLEYSFAANSTKTGMDFIIHIS